MTTFIADIDASLDEIRADGLWKTEETLTSPSGAMFASVTGAR